MKALTLLTIIASNASSISALADTLTLRPAAIGSIVENHPGNIPAVHNRSEPLAQIGSDRDFRGVAEFDLSLLTPLPNASVTLVLPDSGGSVAGVATTSLRIYSGDGLLTVGDWDISASQFTTVSRGFQDPPTLLDITSLVNSFGSRYLGFKFEGQTFDKLDAFQGTYLEYSSNVPEPTSVAFLICGAALLSLGRTYRDHDRNAEPCPG